MLLFIKLIHYCFIRMKLSVIIDDIYVINMILNINSALKVERKICTIKLFQIKNSIKKMVVNFRF